MTQGKDDYVEFINIMKKDILGNENVKNLEFGKAERSPKYILLQTQCEQWQQLLDKFIYHQSNSITNTQIKQWYILSKYAKKQITALLFTLQQI